MNDRKFKLTFSGGVEGDKVVVLREPQMSDVENAMKAVGNQAGENQNLFGLLLAKELVKICVISVDGKDLKGVDREQINKHFSMGQIITIGSKLQEIMNSGGESEEVKLEILSSGDR